MLKKVTVKVPATTANCGAGFDTVGMACSLYNLLELSVREDTSVASVEVFGEGISILPVDEYNLAVKAVRKVLSVVGNKQPGFHIVMHNQIPLSRGLGSSAAAVVAGLTAGNVLTGTTLSSADILNLAVEFEGHPDNVAPAIYGGATVSFMHGEKADCLRFLPPQKLELVAVIPEVAVATHKAREVLPKSVNYSDAVFNISRTGLLIGSLYSGDYKFLQYALDDKLHQPYREKLIPGMTAVFAAAIQAGAMGAVISGSGSTLMAYTIQNADVIGAAMVNVFSSLNIKSRYEVLAIDTTGVSVIA